jgi:uncharacterized GH25 family protein
MMRTFIITTACFLRLAVPAWGHDYWLLPDHFFLANKGQTALHLHVGESLKSEFEQPFQKDRTARFQLDFAKGKKDLMSSARDGKKPWGPVAVRGAGTYLVSLERNPQFIKLAADKFTRYLTDEGLSGILEQRKQLGESKQAGRERYTRYLKCLLQAGDRRDSTHRRILGQKLEIVPRANPYRLKRNDPLRVRILFEGKPLAGVRVFAHQRAGDQTHTQTAVTGKDGQASFKLDRAGSWLIRLVHMRRRADRTEADWDSFWGALTFATK